MVAIGGALGAPLRYLTDRFVQARHDTVFPWGTFTVNAVGSFILGLIAGLAIAGATGSTVTLLVGVGFCGALTTYSTLSYETVRLVEQGARYFAIANMAVTIAAGIGAVTVGYGLGSAIGG